MGGRRGLRVPVKVALGEGLQGREGGWTAVTSTPTLLRPTPSISTCPEHPLFRHCPRPCGCSRNRAARPCFSEQDVVGRGGVQGPGLVTEAEQPVPAPAWEKPKAWHGARQKGASCTAEPRWPREKTALGGDPAVEHRDLCGDRGRSEGKEGLGGPWFYSKTLEEPWRWD